MIQLCVCIHCIHTYIYSFPDSFLLYRFLQNIDYSSLCYAVDPCWLSVLYIVVYKVLYFIFSNVCIMGLPS